MPSFDYIFSFSLLAAANASAAPATTPNNLSKRQDDSICVGITFFSSDDCSGPGHSTTITDWGCYNLDTSYNTWGFDDPSTTAQINVYDLLNCHGSDTYGDEPMPAWNLHGCNVVQGGESQVQSTNLNLAG